MDFVVLDTCIVVNCALINAPDADPELLVKIVGQMRKKGVGLLLPEVVELEYGRKIPEELARVREQTKSFRDVIKTRGLPRSDAKKLQELLDRLDADRASAAERASAFFDQVAGDENLTTRIPLTGEIVAEAVRYSLGGLRPSKSKDLGRGLIDPDSLIVASIAGFAREASPESAELSISICSDNHRDFAEWDESSQQHKLADEIEAAIPCPVRFYKNPRDLIERELQLDVEKDEALSEVLDDYEEVERRPQLPLGGLAGYLTYLQDAQKAAIESLASQATGAKKGIEAFNRQLANTARFAQILGLSEQLNPDPHSGLAGLGLGGFAAVGPREPERGEGRSGQEESKGEPEEEEEDDS